MDFQTTEKPQTNAMRTFTKLLQQKYKEMTENNEI